MKKTHYILYVPALLWNVTVCWPAVLLIRLFWGENLRWEQNPDPKIKDGWSLWCDLKRGSWPTRTWYAKYESGSWVAFLGKEKPIPNPESLVERHGPYRTWGGTTLGHGGFYGPGLAKKDGWTRLQDHEHHHVEQFEAASLGSFLVGVIQAVVLLALGHPTAALVDGLFLWWSGYLIMGIQGWTTAALRGEPAYRGSVHEEAAYALDDDWHEGAKHAEGEG